jgi:hypothetical protein
MPQITKQTTRPVSNGPAKSVIDRIAPIGFKDDEGLKMLVYGRSGTGKTTFAATFPGPILWLVCSGGSKPGELRSIDTPEYRKKVSQVVIQSGDEMAQVTEHVKTAGKFATVVLDHVSGFQDRILADILGMEELPAQRSYGMATQQQYGQCTLLCKEYLRSFLGLPCNVVLVAQERTFGDDGALSDIIRPTVGAALTPSLTGWLNPACDYVCQTFLRPKMVKVSNENAEGGFDMIQKGVEYCLRTEPHDVFQTKFRIPKSRVSKMPDAIVDPDYAKVVKLLRG